MRAFNWLINRHPPAISHDQAIALAHQECIRRAWTWLEPIDITHRFGVWYIRTNAGKRGASAIIHIDQTTGQIKHAGYIAR